MDDLLTTRQLQEILKVDRITIYRMLSDGRLNGIKVGNQWRFQLSEIEKLIDRGKTSEKIIEQPAPSSNFPLHCIQALQDVFADIGQVSATTIDQNGLPLTETSHPCSLCKLMQGHPAAYQGCLATWKEIASRPTKEIIPQYLTCHAGLSIVAEPIIFEGEYIACLLAEGFFAHQPLNGDLYDRIQNLGSKYNIKSQAISEAIGQVIVLDEDHTRKIINWPRLVVKTINSILSERASLADRLQKIAEITNSV